MKTLDYLEKIDDTLGNWEDYFHGQEGTDVTEARANLGKVREQLIIHSVNVPNGTLCECNGNERIALDCTMKPCKHPNYFKG